MPLRYQDNLNRHGAGTPIVLYVKHMILYDTSLRNKAYAAALAVASVGLGFMKAWGAAAYICAIATALPAICLLMSSRKAWIDSDSKELSSYARTLSRTTESKIVPLHEFTTVQILARALNALENTHTVLLVGPREHFEVGEYTNRSKAEEQAERLATLLRLPVEDVSLDADPMSGVIKNAVAPFVKAHKDIDDERRRH